METEKKDQRKFEKEIDEVIIPRHDAEVPDKEPDEVVIPVKIPDEINEITPDEVVIPRGSRR